jgi:hypothetical protein
VAWSIVDGPGEGPWEGRDAVGWIWVVENEAQEQRWILVEISGTAMAVDEEHLPAGVRDAKRTRGRSAVEAVLDSDSPPRRLMFTTQGLSPAEE